MNPWFQITTIAFALTTLTIAGPPPQQPAAKPKQREPVFLTAIEAGKFLKDRFDRGKLAVFISRDGKAYGMDSDSVVCLKANGEMVLGEYGYTPQGYKGTYAIGKDGTFVVTLKGYRSQWPEMKLAREGDAVRLYAKSGDRSFVMGDRGGAFESSDMKPFWPFRLVENGAAPSVTPIFTSATLRTFSSPVLPADFVWRGERIEFRLDFDLSSEGKATVTKHFASAEKNNRYAEGDWRLDAVKSAQQAMESWSFDPLLEDGKPVKEGGYWNFTVSRVNGRAHWIVKENGVVTIFDNMPRLSTE